MATSYIGVTGFTSRSEVEFALAQFESTTRLFMVGVLASPKGLRGENKWPNRYARRDTIDKIFVEHPFAINMIHYATDDPDTIDDQLSDLIDLIGDPLDGFQLNMVWPDPVMLTPLPILTNKSILQIGRKALEMLGNNPTDVAKKLDEYTGIISDILIDASGGKGIPLDPGMALQYLDAITDRHGEHFGLGVAGGLSGSTLHLVEQVLAEYPRVSIDAEGKLRDALDHLDRDATYEYIDRAIELTKKYW